MKATFVTLGLLLATSQARSLKSLLQTDSDLVALTPGMFGFAPNCNFTWTGPGGPGGPGNPPVLDGCEC